MRHIIIKNLGPIEYADVELKQRNIIIGPQSTGKSCVLKTVCFCRWVEKSIQLSQSPRDFATNDAFLSHLVSFHKLDEYINESTYISYESDFAKFSFDNSRMENEKLQFVWNEDNRWNYRRPQISYIPAERNLVAVVPNWLSVNLPKGNILSFMSEWNEARHQVMRSLPILDLRVSYQYDEISDKDLVYINNMIPINFTNTSSGLHALIPLFVHINYLANVKPNSGTRESVQVQDAEMRLRAKIVIHLIKKYDISPMDDESSDSRLVDRDIEARFKINNKIYPFSSSVYKEYSDILGRFQKTDHFEFFIEEPEENLFPVTQESLMEWLNAIIEKADDNVLFIATHSPHILQYFIDKDLDVNLMRLRETGSEKNKVETLTDAELTSLKQMGAFSYYKLDWCI